MLVDHEKLHCLLIPSFPTKVSHQSQRQGDLLNMRWLGRRRRIRDSAGPTLAFSCPIGLALSHSDHQMYASSSLLYRKTTLAVNDYWFVCKIASLQSIKRAAPYGWRNSLWSWKPRLLTFMHWLPASHPVRNSLSHDVLLSFGSGWRKADPHTSYLSAEPALLVQLCHTLQMRTVNGYSPNKSLLYITSSHHNVILSHPSEPLGSFCTSFALHQPLLVSSVTRFHFPQSGDLSHIRLLYVKT